MYFFCTDHSHTHIRTIHTLFRSGSVFLKFITPTIIFLFYCTQLWCTPQSLLSSYCYVFPSLPNSDFHITQWREAGYYTQPFSLLLINFLPTFNKHSAKVYKLIHVQVLLELCPFTQRLFKIMMVLNLGDLLVLKVLVVTASLRHDRKLTVNFHHSLPTSHKEIQRWSQQEVGRDGFV